MNSRYVYTKKHKISLSFYRTEQINADFQLVIVIPTLFQVLDPAKYVPYKKIYSPLRNNPVDNSSLRHQGNNISLLPFPL